MNEIKELILQYLLCYGGSQLRTINRICVDLCGKNYSEYNCRKDVIQGFKELEREEKIKYISLNEMTEFERKYFELDSSPIYRIVK